jgi:hypothetical protein
MGTEYRTEGGLVVGRDIGYGCMWWCGQKVYEAKMMALVVIVQSEFVLESHRGSK